MEGVVIEALSTLPAIKEYKDVSFSSRAHRLKIVRNAFSKPAIGSTGILVLMLVVAPLLNC